jgi:CubicO group peptidase (beta-lactamase class C family)
MRAAVIPVVLLAASCRGDRSEVEPPPPPAPPVRIARRLDSAVLERAELRARALPRLRSLLVQWRGEIVLERYYNGATAQRRANIKSASKSVMSALVGIAIAQQRIAGVQSTIGELLPSEAAALEPEKRAITVADLLSMRSGLQSTSFDNYGAWVTSRNWVRHALTRPMVAPRGEAGPMIYSTGSTHLLSAILARHTGGSTWRFAQRNLARPLGIDLRPWQADPQGIHFGGNDMYLTPREMLRFGTLYLHRGAWNGRQVVPADWVDSSLVRRTSSPWNGNGYGYGWWSRTTRGVRVHYAWGYGGQFVFIVPDLELVVVMTSDAESARAGGHNSTLHGLLDDGIVPAVSTP